MIWDSVVWMTFIDLLIICAVGSLAVVFWRHKASPSPRQAMLAPWLILAGLACTALFYLMDLVSMYLLPALVGQETAMTMMTSLHVEARWLFSIASLALICAGLLQYIVRDRQSRLDEARSRGFEENTSDWVWEMDQHERHSHSNRQVQDLLGYRPEELDGMHWKDLVHPETVEKLEQGLNQAMQEKQGWRQLTMVLRHSDGSYRYTESTADPLIASNGDLAGYRGINRDITFRALMSRISRDLVGRTAAELDARIERAFGLIGLCYGIERISLWWLEAQHVRLSHEWAADNVRIPTRQFNPDDQVPRLIAELRQGRAVTLGSLAELPEGGADHTFLVRQGSRSLLLIPLFENGVFVGTTVFATTSRERAWSEDVESDVRQFSEKIAAAYAQSEATRMIQRRKRDLAQSESLAHVGSFAYYPQSDDARFPEEWQVEFSQQQCNLLDIEPEDASFELFLSRVHADDRQAILDAADRLLSGQREIELKFRVVKPGGELRHIFNRTHIDRDEQGRSLRIIGANRDITDQVLREKSLQKALSEIEELRSELEEKYDRLREEVRTIKGFEQIVGDSRSLRTCLDLVARAAPTDAAILILGETGVGKELIAKSVHDLSSRREAPMVSLNCTALPTELVESELFGHERGAFTGAHQRRKGRFEIADGGTLFLDEIGDLPLPLQGKLLRVLEDSGFERLGGTETMFPDVRLIAATNRDLQEAVKSGSFRADLYYRINTVPIEVPPLRERKEDIPALAQHFVMKHAPRFGKSVESISSSMLRHLQERRWPGNVRELEHFIERALISQRGPVLTLASQGTGVFNAIPASSDDDDALPANLRSVERDHILQVLDESLWVIGGSDGAATKLGLPPSTLRSKMKKLGIERRQ